MMPTLFLPPLLVCEQCGNSDRTTACRFCGVSLIPESVSYRHVVQGFAVDATFESDYGAKRVGFRSVVESVPVRVVAVIAPPDVEVGILDPYPLECVAVSEDGVPIELTYKQARFLCSTVFHQLF